MRKASHQFNLLNALCRKCKQVQPCLLPQLPMYCFLTCKPCQNPNNSLCNRILVCLPSMFRLFITFDNESNCRLHRPFNALQHRHSQVCMYVMSGLGLPPKGVLLWGFGAPTHRPSTSAPTKWLPHVGEGLGRRKQSPPAGPDQRGNPCSTEVSHPSPLGGKSLVVDPIASPCQPPDSGAQGPGARVMDSSSSSAASVRVKIALQSANAYEAWRCQLL